MVPALLTASPNGRTGHTRAGPAEVEVSRGSSWLATSYAWNVILGHRQVKLRDCADTALVMDMSSSSRCSFLVTPLWPSNSALSGRPEFSSKMRDNLLMPTEPPHPPPAAAKPPRVHVTPEDLERFGDEEQVREALDERRLRDDQPPHHH